MKYLIVISLFLIKSSFAQILLYDHYKHFQFKEKASQVALSPDNRFLAYGIQGKGDVTIIDLKVKKVLRTISTYSKLELMSLEFDKENLFLVAAYKEKKIVIWDVISGAEETVIDTYNGKISQVVIAGNNEMMAVMGSLDEIYLYHFPSGELKGQLKNGHSKNIIGCHFNQNGDRLVSLGEDQQLIFWNCQDLRIERKMEVNPMTMEASGTKVTAIDVGESGDVIAVAFEEMLLDKGGSNMIFLHNIALYDWRTASLIKVIEGNVKKIHHLQLSPDNSHVLADNSTFSENRLSFWNKESGTYDQKQIIYGEIVDFDLSASGSMLAISYHDPKNKDGTYIGTFEISGMEQKQVATINKGVSISSAASMQKSMTQQEVYPKAFAGDLKNTGKYYALIIGINEYEDDRISDLDQPVQDATRLYQILTDSYTFNPDDIVFLQNPTRADIIMALDNIEANVTQEDNLLIFYAGHGYWDEKTQKGYWLPSDARQDNTANWFRNSSLSGYISSIKSKHTLLIADACFSGSIFKTRDAFGNMDKGIERLYKLPSRKAMTSGTLKVVPDKSVFLQYLTKRLEENEDSFLSSEQLFFSFKTAVLNNSQNIPQFGEISNSGDEGGDFIFIKK